MISNQLLLATNYLAVTLLGGSPGDPNIIATTPPQVNSSTTPHNPHQHAAARYT